jgi:hypothetical protein
MEIDAGAPAVARHETEVEAAPEIVWAVLTDIAGWPSWNPDVASASPEGPLARGTQFRWKAGPGTITSTLQDVERPHLITWTGTTLGINAIHVHRLERRGDSTFVTSEESWDGLLVRLLRRSMTKALHKAIESGLRHLKVEAERRAATTSAP